jgi:AbrB family looped-hinge helix DNA binding protein
MKCHVEDQMLAVKARVNEQGRLVIPAEVRAASGISPGSEVVLEVREGEVRMRSIAAAAARVQKKYKRLARGRKIVDELLAERREEAQRE